MTQVNYDYVGLFWDLFRYVDWADDDLIEVRKISTDGLQQQSLTIQPALQANTAEWMAQKCEKGAGKIGYFMAPAVLNEPRANDKSVQSLVCLSVDIDNGDTDVALSKLKTDLGQPTLVVHSGGVTKTGHKKLHVHWRFAEPETDTSRVANLREAIALDVGGDISFKRIPQVIRIAGSIYDKTGNGELVEVLESYPDREVEFQDALEVYRAKRRKGDYGMAQEAYNSGAMDFSGGKVQSQEQKHDRLIEVASGTIPEGGTDTDNRFIRFTEYAGRWVAHARSGDCTIDEAAQHVLNWNTENMDPPWIEARVSKEFNSILNLDKKNHPDLWSANTKPSAVAEEAQNDWSWLNFSAEKLFVGKPPPIPWIIDQLICDGAAHAIVADGGVGKTYIALETAMKAAIGKKKGNNIFGFEVLEKCVSVVITVEDGKDDLHRRMYGMDPSGQMIKKTEGRMLVLPVADELMGGLTLVEKDKLGNHKMSEAWTFLTDKLNEVKEKWPDLPMLVILDTYSATHHGDENSSGGTNEWFRAASVLKTKYNAATLITHHVRKTGMEPINTPSDMRAHIRGSNAFQNNCRIAFGVWEMPGSQKLAQEAVGDEEEKANMNFFNFAPLKANIPLDWHGRTNPEFNEPVLTLRRTGSGQLIFDADMHEKRLTYKERAKEKAENHHNDMKAQAKAAIELSIREYATAGRPLNINELIKDKKIFLPYPVSDMNKKDIQGALDQMILDKEVVRINVRHNRTRMNIHDMVDGPYAMKEEDERVDHMIVMEWNNFSYDHESKKYVSK